MPIFRKSGVAVEISTQTAMSENTDERLKMSPRAFALLTALVDAEHPLGANNLMARSNFVLAQLEGPNNRPFIRTKDMRLALYRLDHKLKPHGTRIVRRSYILTNGWR